MSERFTGIDLPGVFGSGFAERGRKSVAEMIAFTRKHAASQRAVYDAILAASDDDFRVSTYVGAYVVRNREVLQEGRRVTVNTSLPRDVVELVIAARIVAFEDQSPEALKRLDKASEAFADRVPWENEQDLGGDAA